MSVANKNDEIAQLKRLVGILVKRVETLERQVQRLERAK